MLPHAYTFELVQLAGALIGVILNAYALVEAMKDAQALARTGLNGTRRLVASSNIQQELIRLVIQILLVVTGVTASILPPPPDLPEAFMWSGNIQRSVLLLITFMLAFKGLLDVRDRRVLLRLWIAEQDRRRNSAAPPAGFPDRRSSEE